jgi:hypothetical protein
MKLLPVAAAVMAAALTLATAALAAGPIPAPPLGGPGAAGSAASTIYDAMLAIARSEADNAPGAQNATSTYNQAIQQYNAGQYVQARQTALNAIGLTAPAPLPAPSLYPLYIPQPAYNPMPLVVNADEADAENVVALARGQLTQCGSGTPPPAVQAQYTTAAANLVARNYLTARGQAEVLINYCASAMQQVAQQAAAQPQPSMTPIPMQSYVPQPFATLIPDPALAQAPVVMPAGTPQPPSHRFHFYGF